jgi:hypothetical protein
LTCFGKGLFAVFRVEFEVGTDIWIHHFLLNRWDIIHVIDFEGPEKEIKLAL